MQSNERPPSYPSDAYNASIPPPTYVPHTPINNNDNRNSTFNDTSSYRRLDIGNLNSGYHPTNDNSNNTQSPPQHIESWINLMFRVDTRDHETFLRVDTQMGNWGELCVIINCVAAAILICVAGAAIRLYENPWHQSQVIGGATMAYGLSGTILGCVTGFLGLGLALLTLLNPPCGLVFHLIIVAMYAASGALTGYGSYITRNNNICNIRDNGADLDDCYNIRLSDGWRCGIVMIAMCAINVITPILYSVAWCITWLRGRSSRRSRDVNVVV